ncbi:DUF3306 domain-containing protein [Bordetella sp. BOR01]|uniref:DUF3306 domain-containing protein n=1 Tax=Bordetella sp. BOR01 TaxID=2854779 RepID=UPI002106FA99|nr:DUF3306 domain-containing protein [Bordetella sp. BOR01]
MMASDPDGFLQRWSRRKVQVREGLPPDGAPLPDAPAVDPAGVESAKLAAAPRDEASPELPALTLDDVRALTPESDFAPFVARQVAPDVKNAALKKLFSDPRYNVMDGLDTYIDDYSNMQTLPASMLARLASARALAMFDPADDTTAAPPSQPGQDAAPQPAQSRADDALPPVAHASPTPDVDTDIDAHPDPDPATTVPGRASAQRQG